jgi:hypothetical protein
MTLLLRVVAVLAVLGALIGGCASAASAPADVPPSTASSAALAPSPSPSSSTTADDSRPPPAWCVDDDGQAKLTTAVAERIRKIGDYSPGFRPDELTVKVTLMAECPPPPGLEPAGR